MARHLARIERTGRWTLEDVEVEIWEQGDTVSGLKEWNGRLWARIGDFQTGDEFALSPDNGRTGRAVVAGTGATSRTRDKTLVEFKGLGPLV
jgi:hypothetical protein